MKVQESCRPINEDPIVKKKIARLRLVYPFDLRGLQSKIDFLSSLPANCGWVVFLNKSGNLAHIMHREDSEAYIRMKIPSGIAGSHPTFMQRWFYNRMEGRYVI